MSLNLKEFSLDWALAHVLLYGDTNIFPALLEYEAIEEDWEEVKSWLLSQNILTWSVGSSRTVLAPKYPLGFRRVTQLDPFDYLVFSALIREIGKRLEEARIVKDANIVFSYRFRPTSKGKFFDDQVGYKQFQEESRRLCLVEKFSHVLITDISDFYPRLYHHRIENALESVLGEGSTHVAAIMEILKQFSGGTSYGLPIGPAASHILAELAINDVDQFLKSEGVVFTRYVDDYRFFCNSESEAYRVLHLLANSLDVNHGLTLQPRKTKIVSTYTFLSKYASDPEETEQSRLSVKIDETLELIGVESLYEAGHADLTPEQRTALERLNLSELLLETLDAEDLDVGLVSFLLRRLAQLADSSASRHIVSHLGDLFTHMRLVAIYYHNVLDQNSENEILSHVGRVVALLKSDEKAAASNYNKMVIATLLRHDKIRFTEEYIVKLYSACSDDNVRREIVLAMGQMGMGYWLSTLKPNYMQLTPWVRRAAIAALSCLPADQYKYWARSMKPHVTQLERAIFRYYERHPMRKAA